MRKLVFVPCLVAVGCSAPPEAPPSAHSDLLAGSWVATVVEHPEAFAALTGGPDRPGWIALHSNDLERAAAAFAVDGPSAQVGRARALLEISLLYDDLARSGDQVWLNTFATWSEKSSIPVGSALTYVAGLAAREQGDAEVSTAWLKLSEASRDEEVARAAAVLAQTPLGAPAVGADLPALLVRYNAHLAARESGDVGALLTEATQPLVQEDELRPDGTTLHRAFYDPEILKTLAIAYRLQAGAALGGGDPMTALASLPAGADPLAGVIFSPVLRADELPSELSRAAEAPGTLGASSAALAALGLEPQLPPTDDGDWARDQVHRLDDGLDAWKAQAREAAGPDGQALLDDLRLVEVLRSRLLLAFARAAMAAQHPWQAKTFAQLALDADESRAITPVNHPALQAILIEAQLRTGHTREALDCIQPLLSAHPALTGLDEVLGDLAILQGLDRYGDSKEN
ncbi:MAG: hypothetical protein ABIO70_29840 [Pseudomonadota bacterium]